MSAAILSQFFDPQSSGDLGVGDQWKRYARLGTLDDEKSH
jgi:hypothetical protein